MKKINESELEVGDVILTTTNQVISKGIRAATKGEISHAMIYVQSHSVIDATSDGVQARNTQRLFFDDDCAIHVLRLIEPLSDDEMRLVTDYARSCVGTEYSKKEALQTVLGRSNVSTKKQFCSRLVARAYANGGVVIVTDVDYCTPNDIQESVLLRPVDNSVRYVSKDEIDARQGIPSTPERMIDATNSVLAGARKIDRSIQDFSDIDHYLIEHPEHDEYFSSLYRESGYLTLWAFEKNKNEWIYVLEKMEAFRGDDSEKRYYCEDLCSDLEEGIRRFEVNLAAYTVYLATYKLETFRLLHDLYATLASLHMQRVEVAREWLAIHSRDAAQ